MSSRSVDTIYLNSGIFLSFNINKKTTKTYTVCRTDRLENLERDNLKPLPLQPYENGYWIYQQRVDESYHVYYKESYYSVPHQYAYHIVDIKICHDFLHVYYQQQRIASHNLNSTSKTNPDHLSPDHRFILQENPASWRAWAKTFGQATSFFVEKNLADKRNYHSKLKQLSELRRHVKKNHWEHHLEKACIFISELNCFNVQRLISILKRSPFSLPDVSLEKRVIEHSNIRGSNYFKKKEK